jgi:hypothetical protein
MRNLDLSTLAFQKNNYSYLLAHAVNASLILATINGHRVVFCSTW